MPTIREIISKILNDPNAIAAILVATLAYFGASVAFLLNYRQKSKNLSQTQEQLEIVDKDRRHFKDLYYATVERPMDVWGEHLEKVLANLKKSKDMIHEEIDNIKTRMSALSKQIELIDASSRYAKKESEEKNEMLQILDTQILILREESTYIESRIETAKKHIGDLSEQFFDISIIEGSIREKISELSTARSLSASKYILAERRREKQAEKQASVARIEAAERKAEKEIADERTRFRKAQSIQRK